MKRTRPYVYAFAVCIASLVAIAPAWADQPSPQQPHAMKSQTMSRQKSATATVVAVDTQNRELTLRDERGNVFTIDIPAEVRRLDEIKKGDRLEVSYYESFGLTWKKSTRGSSSRITETETLKRRETPLPSGVITHQITADVQIVSVDRANNEVTIKTPTGHLDTISVTDPAMQKKLGELHAGDRIQATYTEALAVSVSRQPHAQ